MASRGMFFGEGPTACPFVALENDRDRRSDEPDHRHRCYAEPDPAPRALAHQREYCLAAAFTACPIFQDWAIRAAATPVPLRPGRMADVERDPEPAWQAPPPWFADQPASEATNGPTSEAADRQPSPEQAPAAEGFVAPPPRAGSDIGRLPSLPLDDGRPVRPAGPPLPPVPPRQPQSQAPSSAAEPVGEPEPESPAAEVLPPPFLADRAGRNAAASSAHAARPDFVEPRPSGQRAPAEDRLLPSERLRREDVVPSWGREPHYPLKTRSKISYADSGRWISRITTLLAIGVLLSLALVAMVLAPSLLGGGDGPARTPPVAGASPTAQLPTPTPRPTSTPAPTPLTHVVQPGDTLFSIAQRNGLTVEQLLAANPQITNPDLLQIGQVLIIPDPDFALFTPTPAASP